MKKLALLFLFYLMVGKPSHAQVTGSATLTVSTPPAAGVFCGATNFGVALPHCDPSNPAANTVFVTAMPDTSNYTVVTVNGGGDLQTAINNASCSPNGTIINLAAGSTFNTGRGSPTYGNGPYNLPNKTCAAGQWIIIQSSAISSLPASGTRVDPTRAANMPNIQTIGGVPALTVMDNANHYRFIGVQFSAPAFADTVVLIDLSSYDNGGTGYPNAAHHLIFDRCWIHGNNELLHDYRRGVYMQGNFVAALDSYIDQFHANTVNTGADTQAIFMEGGLSGPFKIVNNYLSSSGENILSGGAPNGLNSYPADFEIRHNHFHKPAQLWMASSTGIVTKNLFELKNAVRLLIDGNVFDTTWNQAQSEALAWKSSIADSGPGTQTHDVTFTHNLVIHAPSGMVFANDGGGPDLSNLLFQNNLFMDLNDSTWGDGTLNYWILSGDLTTHNYVFDHNTALQAGPSIWTFEMCSNGAPGQLFTVQVTNNIFTRGDNGVSDCDRGNPEGNPTINSYFASPFVWNQNVFINSTSLASIYPNGTLWATPNSTAIGFTDNTNCVGGTFTASACTLTSTSPFHKAGTDGKDIGADIQSILAATSGVVQVHD